MHYDSELIVENFKKQDNDTLEFIYKKFYPSVQNLIVLNSGSEDDARDIFQEALIIVYRKLTYDDLQLTCSFNTFLYSVAKRLWLKELEKRKVTKSQMEIWNGFSGSEQEDAAVTIRDERYRIYQEHFLALSERCQKLLRLYYQKVPLRDIAELLGLSSEKYAKKRKYQCKESLMKRIQSDPRFLNL